MKKILFACCFIFALTALRAQEMASLFTAMPDQYIPQLENAWRKDLVDLYNSGKEAKLKNTMEGYSTLKKLTTDYLLLQVTDNSTMEIKRLPLVNNTYIICVVNTVFGPAADSRVAFFTTDWKSLDATDLYTPATTDWFFRGDADRKSDEFLFAASWLDIQLIQYSLSEDNFTMKATFTTPQYLGKEEREKVAPFLKTEPRMYTWEKSHFN